MNYEMDFRRGPMRYTVHRERGTVVFIARDDEALYAVQVGLLESEAAPLDWASYLLGLGNEVVHAVRQRQLAVEALIGASLRRDYQ